MTRFVCVLALIIGLAPSCASDPPPVASRSTASPTVAPTASPTPAGDLFARARSYLASSPAELARRLTDAERSIRSGQTVGIEERAHVQQALYRQLVTEPSWVEPVLEDVPAELRAVVRANVEAGADLRALTAPRPALPNWRIVAPPRADELRGHYEHAEKEFGVSWNYLAAIHLVETRMGRIRGASTAGARGPMQFLPSTWERWGSGDIEDARDSIRAAARYLRGHGAPGDMARALYAYNHSRLYVRAITLYAEQMRAEPRAYLGYYHWQVYYRTIEGDALLEVGWSG